MSARTEPGDARARGGPPSFRDRLLADGVAALVMRTEKPGDDRRIIDQLAARTEREPEHLVLEYAKSAPSSRDVRGALESLRTPVLITIALAAIVALAAGGAAARATLADHTASVFALLVGLLGVQMMFLLLWIFAMAVAPRAFRGGFLGEFVMRAGRWISARVHHDSAHAAAVESSSRAYARSPVGRWALSSITHGLWAAANVGMLLILALSFLGEGYSFRWDSTWLSDRSYVQMVESVATLPGALGFDTPDGDEIEMSRRPPHDTAGEWSEDTRRAWSWFFFGSVVTYGLLPRGILLALSMVLLTRARKRYRLDLSHPAHARTLRRIAHAAQVQSISHERESEIDSAIELSAASTDNRPVGAAAIVGLEIERPQTGWPPQNSRGVRDLGILDGLDDRRKAARALGDAPERPAALIIVCELGASPDRGLARAIAELRREAGSPAFVVLTGGRRAADDLEPDALSRRGEDWRALAAAIGIPRDHVLELDLDHATTETQRKLSAIAQGDVPPRTSERRIEAALDRIQERAGRWGARVDAKELLTAHRDLGELYGHARNTWTRLFLPGEPSVENLRAVLKPDQVSDQMKGVISRVQSILPASLRVRPRWMAAGALAGALGCITAAGVVAPAVVAALPAWTITGGILGGIMSAARGEQPRDAESTEPTFAEAVSATVLFALILELQGRDEPTISRIIARTLSEDDPPPDQETLRDWLDQLRHRFDIALAGESPT